MGKRPRPSFNDLRAGCDLLEKAIRDCAGKVTYEQLIDESFWYEFVSPDLDSPQGSYMYMGRKFTGDVIRFILEGTKAKGLIEYTGPPLHHSSKKESFIRYLSGTPGFGKTVSLNAAFVHLYLQSTNSQDHRKRFVLLAGERFVEEPLQALLAGLVMAYIKDEQALGDLEELADFEKLDPSSRRAFCWFLRERSETVHIILDDGDAFDGADGETEESKGMKEAAFSFLTSLMRSNVKVVICASAGRKVRSIVHKERADYLLGTGGFSEDEVCNLIRHLTGDKEPRALASDLRRITGWVPRLVVEFLTNKRAFEMSTQRLELDLVGYVENALRGESGYEKDPLFSAVAGRKIPSLSPLLDSGWLYSGPDGGKAEFLTSALYDIAVKAVVETVVKGSRKETKVETSSEVV